MSEQRLALVTGAASGIGKSIATEFAKLGLQLLLVDRSEAVNDVARTISQGGVRADGYVCDLAIPAEILKLTAHIRTSYGRCDILVNNAGVHPKDNAGKVSLAKMELASWQYVFDVNLTAPFLLCQQLMPLMQERKWGRIINISSRAGRTLIPACGAHYAASKAGLIGLTRIVAEEGASYGITANTVAPGRIVTPLSSTVTPTNLEASLKAIPLHRVGQPEELAAVVCFLASDAASYMTGAVLDVNGGSYMP